MPSLNEFFIGILICQKSFRGGDVLGLAQTHKALLDKSDHSAGWMADGAAMDGGNPSEPD
jgi:hypothetical protein